MTLGGGLYGSGLWAAGAASRLRPGSRPTRACPAACWRAGWRPGWAAWWPRSGSRPRALPPPGRLAGDRAGRRRRAGHRQADHRRQGAARVRGRAGGRARSGSPAARSSRTGARLRPPAMLAGAVGGSYGLLVGHAAADPGERSLERRAQDRRGELARAVAGRGRGDAGGAGPRRRRGPGGAGGRRGRAGAGHGRGRRLAVAGGAFAAGAHRAARRQHRPCWPRASLAEQHAAAVAVAGPATPSGWRCSAPGWARPTGCSAGRVVEPNTQRAAGRPAARRRGAAGDLGRAGLGRARLEVDRPHRQRLPRRGRGQRAGPLGRPGPRARAGARFPRRSREPAAHLPARAARPARARVPAAGRRRRPGRRRAGGPRGAAAHARPGGGRGRRRLRRDPRRARAVAAPEAGRATAARSGGAHLGLALGGAARGHRRPPDRRVAGARSRCPRWPPGCGGLAGLRPRRAAARQRSEPGAAGGRASPASLATAGASIALGRPLRLTEGFARARLGRA